MPVFLWQKIQLRIHWKWKGIQQGPFFLLQFSGLFLGDILSFSGLGLALSSHASWTIYRLYSDPIRNRPNTLNALTLRYKNSSQPVQIYMVIRRGSVHGSIESTPPLSLYPSVGRNQLSVTQSLNTLLWCTADGPLLQSLLREKKTQPKHSLLIRTMM